MNISFTLFVVTALNSVLGNESVRSKDKGLTLVFQNPTSLMGTVGDDLTTNLPVHWHILSYCSLMDQYGVKAM
jgi:hypothetical protein